MTSTDPEARHVKDAASRSDSEQIIQALDAGKNKRVRKLLGRMHPAKVAAMLELLEAEQRLALWQQIDPAREGRVLPHLSIKLRRQLAGESADAPQANQDSALDSGKSEINHLEAIRDALGLKKLKRVGKILHRMHPAKVAGLLEALPPEERRSVWSMVETERAGKVLIYLHDEIRVALALELDLDDLIASAAHLELDDRVDLIQTLPGELGTKLLRASSASQRSQLESMLAYPEDSAGGLMNADVIQIRADVKVSTVLRYLRLLETLPPQTDLLMVVDRKGHYRGGLRLSVLVTADLDRPVAELLDSAIVGIAASASGSEVDQRFKELDLLSAPVVDEDNRVIGRITLDDVADLMREDSERTLMQMAGLDDEADIFAPVLVSSRRRAVWLGINLITAFSAAWVIGLFQATLEQLVALAVLMPIVASMGGIAGSQTLTLVIRGLALGQVQKGNLRILLNRELGISVLNGVLWAAVIALLAVLWFGNWGLGAVLGSAILINLLCAALAGWGLPLLLERMGIDPALAGSVILTTVTDIVGFFAFLGLASVLLL
ncbi:magnesium transporter [Pseudomonas benzenivorans]|uniref:magnesium transporter n=1 Tax=Pseudomonas benzenivorans TaxID=556533 RepID=UPI0035145AF0